MIKWSNNIALPVNYIIASIIIALYKIIILVKSHKLSITDDMQLNINSQKCIISFANIKKS